LIGSELVFILQKEINKIEQSDFTVFEIKNDKFSEINEIDKIKDDIDNLIKNKVLIQDKKEIKNLPFEPGSKVIYKDKDGFVLKYVKEIGGEDSALTFNFYYNKNGKLAYTLITGGAYNGLDEEYQPISSELEHKIYFSEEGNKIKESHVITKGPGYSWTEVWPENEIILDPLKDFSI
ncbi:MAG: hypothetical protein WCG45_05770, partial [bacterium]